MYPFIEKAEITDLGFGGSFALWGFRAIAGGQGNCRKLNVGFNQAFAVDNQLCRSQHGGGHGRLAMNALKSFAYQLSRLGRRKIILASSGTMRLTADEICIIAALSAAQKDQEDLCNAHLLWLLGTTNTHLAYHAAITYSLVCTNTGIDIEKPKVVFGQKPLSEKDNLAALSMITAG